MNSHKKESALNVQIMEIIDGLDIDDIDLYLKKNNIQKPLLDLLKKVAASKMLLKNKHLKSKKKLTKVKVTIPENLIKETRILQDLSRKLSSTLNVNKILDIFYSACTHIIGFEYVMASLVYPEQSIIKAVGGIGITKNHIKFACHPLDSKDIMADIIRTGKTEIITGWDSRFDKKAFDKEKHEKWNRIFTPISLNKKNIGLVEAGFYKSEQYHIEENQKEMLCSFIDQTSLALQNARSFEKIKNTEKELRLHQDHLEDLVEKRTMELEKSNKQLEFEIKKKERIEKELLESKLYYQEMVDMMPQSLMRHDREGRCTFANQAYLKSLGVSMEEAIGKTDQDIYPHNDALKYDKDTFHVLETGSIVETVEKHLEPASKKYLQTFKYMSQNYSYKRVIFL